MDCRKCLKIAPDAESIKCTSCLAWLHFYCAELSESEFKKILPMNRIKWKCSACKSKKKTTLSTTNSPALSSASPLNVDTEVLTKYMDSKFANLSQQWRDDLNSAILEVSRTFRNDIIALENRINTCEERVAQVESAAVTNSSSLPSNLIEENASLRHELETLSNRLDNFDQASRNCNVEIQNVPEIKGENLMQLSFTLSNILNVELKDSDIKTVHRVKPGVPTGRPRNIILQLTTRRKRDDFIAAARVRGSLTVDKLLVGSVAASGNNRFYVNEHLTLKNKILFSKVRQLARERGYKYVWIKNCCILVRKTDEAKAIQVRSSDDLAKLI
ncbi:uncharacterized protein LOC123690474 [Pieris rapae]|uniref:uncharacterized protein LOC123690474 n=1 Tax=Pieris rapae TaxID=64459 RepID=UPI001E27D9BB|nr:uncharacterized protein LOC123690474 [Pieris rapae]